MIALALSEGVTHLGFYGIHYALDEEHKKQRSGCEYWMGVAVGRGVQLVIPESAPLLKEPGWLYGYESHDKKVTPPPPTVRFEPVADLTVAESRARGRTDVAFDAERCEALLTGGAPVLPDGRLAW